MNGTPADVPQSQSSQSEGIRTLYTELALRPGKDFGWGKGKENARSLGYQTQWLEQLPAVAWESAAAVGNPFSLGPIRPGETVVDLGCGAGTDLCVAALLIGSQGRAYGIDITPAMVAKAKETASLLGKAAGFGDAEMISFTGYRTAPTTIGATFRARKP